MPLIGGNVFQALFYLQYHSVKNRTLMRIQRLRQPKYLAGAVVGALYLYFYFFRVVFKRHQPGFLEIMSPENRQLLEFGGALILFLIVFLAWIFPHSTAALTFSEAEIAFLFPAPISRKGLIHFKLLRSQTAILFTTMLLTLVLNRFGHPIWVHAAGWWLILSTLNLHLLGASFTLTKLMDRGITKWPRRLAILTVVGIAAIAVVIWARRTLPPFDLEKQSDLEGLRTYFHTVFISGPLPYLLYPFRLVIQPYLATSGMAFLKVLPPALLLLVLHYFWVVRSNVSFEEASLAASKKNAERVAAIRAGNWQGARKPTKPRRAPFRLSPTGPPAIAFLWKNLLGAGQLFTLRIWLSLLFFVAFASFGFGHVSGDNGLRPILGMLAMMLFVWSLVLGPQLFRQDFRQDLPMADVLKSYPLRGWQLVVGELLAPVVILTAAQWFLIIALLGFFPTPEFALTFRLAVALGAAIVSPALNFITLQIPNAAVLLFPAWFLPGQGVSHGIEATGQRLIFVFGQFFVFLLALLPAAGVSVGIFFLVQYLTASWLGASLALSASVISAAMTATSILAVEAAGGVMLLGWLFLRFDVGLEKPT